MIKIEKFEVLGFEHAIRGMRISANSCSKSDSFWEYHPCGECNGNSSCVDAYHIGKDDHELIIKLVKEGSNEYRRMIVVYLDITAPMYWWNEFDIYKGDTVVKQCSVMHKICEKEFTVDDFSHEHLVYDETRAVLAKTIIALNHFREAFLAYKKDDETKKNYWRQIIQLLPSSYNQKRTVMLDYEVLAGMYWYYKNNALDEWREFCQWIEKLPYSEIITCGSEKGEVHYICDRRACAKCSFPECKHTTDITYAANFTNDNSKCYIEKEKEAQYK